MLIGGSSGPGSGASSGGPKGRAGDGERRGQASPGGSRVAADSKWRTATTAGTPQPAGSEGGGRVGCGPRGHGGGGDKARPELIITSRAPGKVRAEGGGAGAGKAKLLPHRPESAPREPPARPTTINYTAASQTRRAPMQKLARGPQET